MIQFFIRRHFLVNLLTIMVLIGGVLAWHSTNKEELPDITFNVIRVSTAFSGASAEDVEFYITQPIEEAIRGLDGVRRITSTSTQGSSSISVELERWVKDVDNVVTEVQGQVNSVSLPTEVLDDPRVRVFETSKKAIVDIALYKKDTPLLSPQERRELQNYVRSLESMLLAKPEIFESRRSGYLSEAVNINANPLALTKYEVPLNAIASEISRSHSRSPAGTLKSGKFEQVTLISELDTQEKLSKLVVQGGFDSQPVKLGAVANITDAFEDRQTIYKVNGAEAVILNVVKNTQTGILEALSVTKTLSEQFKDTVLKDSAFELVFLDDESIDVRNRLSIIGTNGLLGFVLIVFSLFVFLNKRSGFWVALGLPFSLAFTLILGHFFGYTINGITLSAVIIVLGIVVDDAIIVAENITRKIQEGMPLDEAVHTGTSEVIAPIIASVVTTCAAFVPLLMFSGRFGLFVKTIPIVIFLMLLGSILESFFLLPAHMNMFPIKSPQTKKAWFETWERVYEVVMIKILSLRYLTLVVFLGIAIIAGGVFVKQFKFVMFPNEETREIVITGEVSDAENAEETALKIQPIDQFLLGYVGVEGVGVRSTIARGRRGERAYENQFRTTLELVPTQEREKSTNQILSEIKRQLEGLEGIENLRFRKQRYGQQSGSVFEIVVALTDDETREALVNALIETLSQSAFLTNIEPDLIPLQREYVLTFNQEQLKRLSVNPQSITTTLRSVLSSRRLYTILRNDEEVDVTLTVADPFRESIKSVLSVPVENSRGYLIPLRELVTVEPVLAKKSIRRQNEKRSSFVYADLKEGVTKSPLEIAEIIERTVFPELLSKYPMAQLYFDGEVVDSRDSKRDLRIGFLTAMTLIFLSLAILFNSALKPFRILIIIPFGLIGVILAFYVHGKVLFGFYAAIGALGMLGVVVNDAIIMLNKLDKEIEPSSGTVASVAAISKTRLRAVFLTTLTTVAGVMPTAYGFGGLDPMLSDMMIALGWGLLFGSAVTLILTPSIFMMEQDMRRLFSGLMSLKKAVMVGMFFWVVSGSVFAQSPLTLSEFIVTASKNDTVFHRMLQERLKLNYDMDIYIPTDALTLDLSSEMSTEESPLQDATKLTLSQTLPNLGQNYAISYTSTEPSVSQFEFSQDIARNAFGRTVRLDATIQGLKTDIAKHQLVEAYEDYLASLISLYYTWIRQYESVALAKSAMRENEKVLESMINRQRQKIANETDVRKIQVQTLAKKENYIRFERNYYETTQLIKRSLAMAPTASLSPDTAIVLDALPEDAEAAFSKLEDTSRTFQILRQLNQESDLAKDRAAMDLLPSARVSARLVTHAQDYGVFGLSVALPLQNTQAKAIFDRSKIDQKETALDTQTTAEELKTSMRNLHQAMRSQKALISIAENKRVLAKQILEAEKENYSYGKISLNDYIDAVNRFDSARFEEIDRRIGYQTLSLEWKRLTDQLVTGPLQ